MALKHRVKIVNSFTMPVSSTEMAKGTVAIFSSSTMVVSTGNVAFVGITTEIGYADKDVLLAGPGSIVLCLAHDDAITEGMWVVPAASGRVDGVAAMSTTIQYLVGIALMDSDAQDHLIPVLFIPGIVTKAGS